MSRKLRVRVNHLAAKKVNACSASSKESLAVTTAVMIFSRCAAYAGYKSNFGSLFFLSSIPFLASATILVFEIYTAIKGSNSSKKSDLMEILYFFENLLKIRRSLNILIGSVLDNMKLKFINFRRLGASYEDPAYVPQDLIRKHWSLYATDFLSFSMGLIMAWVYLPEVIEFGTFRNILDVSVVIVAISLIAGALCGGIENHWYRVTLTISHALFISLIFVLTVNIKISMIATIPSMAAIVLLNFNKRNIAYYQWCKSLKS